MRVLFLFTGTMPPKKKGKSPLSFNSLLRQTLHLSSRKSGKSSGGATEVDSRDPLINPAPINSFIPDAAVYDVDDAYVCSTFPEHQPELHGERESAGERESTDEQDLDEELELDDEQEADGESEQEVHEEEQPTTHRTPGTGKMLS